MPRPQLPDRLASGNLNDQLRHTHDSEDEATREQGEDGGKDEDEDEDEDEREKEDTLDLTIRFSASLADLPLSFPRSANVTTAGLKQRIRGALPGEFQTRRIRLIHAGKGLDDSSVLNTVLKPPPTTTTAKGFKGSRSQSGVSTPSLPPPPPSPYSSTPRSASPYVSDGRGRLASTKGKARTGLLLDHGRDIEKSKGKAERPRIYIHCSIGDVVLSADELTAEKAAASYDSVTGDVAGGGGSRTERYKPNRSAFNHGGSRTNTGVGASASTNRNETADEDETENQGGNGVATSTTPAPRGFDRLLSAGFSAGEVQSLRLQFMAIQAHTHTPDTMPSPNTLRTLEERWLDGESGLGGGGGGTMEGTGGDGMEGGWTEDGEGETTSLDDILFGAAMGFFWPIGCVMWGTREEGIFTPRRKIAIVIGVMLNVGVGLVRFPG